jgi:hypothetical protein
MSKTTVPAVGGAMPVEGSKSRRSALATLGGAAIFVAASGLAAATPVDPIFAAIAEHKALCAWAEERGISDEEVEYRTPICDEKMDELIDLAPTTLAAACALLMHIAESEAVFLDHDTPIMRVVRNVAKALPSIGVTA